MDSMKTKETLETRAGRSTNGTRMIIALCFAIFIPNFAQYQLSPLAAELITELSITPSQFSTLFTAPMIPAVTLSIIAGVLVDRVDPKRVLAVAIGITSLGLVLSIVSTSWLHLMVAFMLIGVSAAVIMSTQAKLISGWYPADQVPRKMGLVMSVATLAMTLALATTALFSSRTQAFTLTASLSALAFGLWLILYRRPPAVIFSAADSGQPGLREGLAAVACNPVIQVIAFCLLWIMAANVLMAVFTPIVLAQRGIDAVSAGYYTALYMVGSFLSCHLAPVLAARLHSVRRAVVVLSILGWFGGTFAVLYPPAGVLLGAAILLTGFTIGGGIPLLMAMPVGLPGVGPRLAGTAGGFIATVQLLGAIVVPSYVLIPLAGDGNHSRLFLLCGLCMAICGLAASRLPKGN